MANKSPNSVVNTIDEGFIDKGSSNFSRRKYTKQVLTRNVISLGFSEVEQGEVSINITFYSSDTVRILPHDNDLMVITVQHGNLDIKRVLIDPESFDDIVFWDAFQKLHLDPNKIIGF